MVWILAMESIVANVADFARIWISGAISCQRANKSDALKSFIGAFEEGVRYHDIRKKGCKSSRSGTAKLPRRGDRREPQGFIEALRP
jgi:hypothetical protein